ncbi:protein eva-1 C-like protein, partial [Leptotrombidium deliense]
LQIECSASHKKENNNQTTKKAKFIVFFFCFHSQCLALLSASLKTFQVHACDGEELKLECMQNTVISIYLAQYGRSGFNAHHLCPESAYSLLQKVEAACREQRICKIMTAPKSFGGIDPCPGVRKYAEVAYKCRPNTFYNRIVCENDYLRLKCDKSYRIVVYSASFGATRFGVPECPESTESPHNSKDQIPKVTEDCQVSYATETVMTACHGKTKCSLLAAISTFGNPGCVGRPRLHLKVVYTCLRKEVLIDTLPGLKPNGEKDNNFVKSEEEVTDEKRIDETIRAIPQHPRYDPRPLEPSLSPTVYISESYVKTKDTTSTKAPTISDKSSRTDGVVVQQIDEHNHSKHSHVVSPERAIGLVSNWIYTYKFIQANQERLLLYLLVSICVSLLLFLLFLSGNLFLQKKFVHKKEQEKDEAIACSPFTTFNEDIIVDDILGELDTRITVASVDTSPFNTASLSRSNRNSSVQRHDSDTHPRAMSGNVNSYF